MENVCGLELKVRGEGLIEDGLKKSNNLGEFTTTKDESLEQKAANENGIAKNDSIWGRTLRKVGYYVVILKLAALAACVPTASRLTSGPPHVVPPNAPPIISDWNSYEGVSEKRSAPHKGIDIGGWGYEGCKVIAPGDGIVAVAGRHPDGGGVVKIYHGKSRYGGKHREGYHFYSALYHLKEVFVKKWEKVKRGQELGYIDYEVIPNNKSGTPHVHFHGGKKKEEPFIPAEGWEIGFTRINPHYYWLGMRKYRKMRRELKKKGVKDKDIPPLSIHIFDPKLRESYPKSLITGFEGYTYVLKCD